MPKTQRSWIPFRKLTDEHVEALKAIGEARTDDEVLAILSEYGLKAKAQAAYRQRLRDWREEGMNPGTKPKLNSSHTLAPVFGVSPRAIAYAKSGTSYRV